MLPTAGTRERNQQSSHVMTVAQLCLLALVPMVGACGDDAMATSDARPSCPSTADPHDEDGDGVVDACDNCPASPNPTQADTGEQVAQAFPDGVGDACDPRPGAAGDDLRGFYSFAADTQASAWTGSGWTISGDAAHAIGNAAWTSVRDQQGDGYYVRVQIASFTPSATGALALSLDGDGVSIGETCTLAATTLTAQEVAGAPTTVMLPTPITSDQLVSFVAWRSVSLSGTQRVPQLRCRVIYGGITKDVTLMLSDELFTGTHVIAASDASVDVTSLSVYTSPGPKNP